jgi:hypothetical protein
MPEQEKLKISCRRTDCKNGLHCYMVTAGEAKTAWSKRSQLMLRSNESGSKSLGVAILQSEIPVDLHGNPRAGPLKKCKACGALLVDWTRVHKQNLGDISYTFNALKTEWIRHHFWHWPLDTVTKTYAYKKGRVGLRERVKTRIHGSIGRAKASELWQDGRQTPFAKKPDRMNVIYCAQHATATCCRKCVEVWHRIPLDRTLTDAEENYLAALAMQYILDRLPDLSENGAFPPSSMPNDIHRKQARSGEIDTAQTAPLKTDGGHSPIRAASGSAPRRPPTRKRPSKRRSL